MRYGSTSLYHGVLSRGTFAMQFASLASCLLIGISIADRIQGQEKGTSPALKDAEKSFSLEKKFTYRGVPEITYLDLGVLDSESEGEIKITLVNDSPDEFRVNAIDVSCSCVSATVPNESIASGKSSLLTVKLKVPEQATAVVQTQSILVRQTNDRAMQIHLRYKVGMMCCFVKTSATVMAPFEQQKVEFSLPLLLTNPLTKADVRVFGEGDLETCKVNLVEAGDSYLAECSLEVPRDGKFTMTGRMVIENIKNRSRSDCDCFVVRGDEVSVAPTTTHFFQASDSYNATAIVRLNRHLTKKSEKGLAKSISVGAKADELKLKVESTDIGNGASRVRLSFDAKALEEAKKKFGAIWLPRNVQWQVAWHGGICEFNTPFGLSDK